MYQTNASSTPASPPSMDSVIGDMDRLRVSALTRAAALSPMVREVTIGPNSPRSKRDTFADTQSLVPPSEDAVERHVKDHVPREDKIFLERARSYEAKLAEASDADFLEMLTRMYRHRAEVEEKLRARRARDAERNEAELRQRLQQMLKAWQYNDPATVTELYDHDEVDTRSSRTIANMNRIIEEQNEVADRIAAIRDSHTTVSLTFDEMSEILQLYDDAKLYDKYAVGLNNVVTGMNNVLEVCASGLVTDKEVKMAQVLAINVVNLKNKAVQDIEALKAEKLKQEEQERIQKEKDLKLQEEIELERMVKSKTTEVPDMPKTVECLTAVAPAKRTKPVFYTNANYEHYKQLQSFLENYEASYSALVSDTTLKNFCFDCRKAVNIPVNSLCSVSGHHMKDKFDKLSKLLKGERVQVMNSYVCATQHPQGLAYCTALLAKKLVSQGHLAVSSNPDAAFPLASITIALWSQFPELGRLIEANFQRQCPYLVPMFLPQKEGQSKEDFYKSLGYLYDDDGVVEKQDMFLKRMSGIFRLCCAIWIAKPPRVMSGQNPHGLRHAWRWVASFVNLKPESHISATLLFDFFAICGNECMKVYGKQFMKIIKLMCTHYLPALDKIDEGGPKSRLEVFLKNILQTGNIPLPSGMLPANVW